MGEDKFLYLTGHVGFRKFVPVDTHEWRFWFTRETYFVSRDKLYPDNHIRCIFSDLTYSTNPHHWQIIVSLTDYDDNGMSYSVPVLPDSSNYADAVSQALDVYNQVSFFPTYADIKKLGFKVW